jgi:DNA polymerase III epsilon subunit-like protein
MRPLSALQRRQMQARRTCTACGEVFGSPVLGPTIVWAQKILADPDAYAILHTETTGLTTTSRIMEIAVTTASGKVPLDTLINPGEPIPGEANRRVRGS